MCKWVWRLKIHPTLIYSCHSFGRLYKLVLGHLNNQRVWEVISKTCVRVWPWYQNIRRLLKALGASPLKLHMPSLALVSWWNTPARFWYITSTVNVIFGIIREFKRSENDIFRLVWGFPCSLQWYTYRSSAFWKFFIWKQLVLWVQFLFNKGEIIFLFVIR